MKRCCQTSGELYPPNLCGSMSQALVVSVSLCDSEWENDHKTFQFYVLSGICDQCCLLNLCVESSLYRAASRH